MSGENGIQILIEGYSVVSKKSAKSRSAHLGGHEAIILTAECSVRQSDH